MKKDKIMIFDSTLRDGEQSPGASLTINEKLIIAKQLTKLGVDVIEAGFPISSSGDFNAVKLISQEVKGPIICGLARAMKKDIDRAWEALKYAEKPRIHTFIATSQIHLDHKFRKSKEEVIQMAVNAIKHAKSYCEDIEFSPEDAARTNIDYMCDVVKAAIAAGATTINIPDTVGYAVPEEYANRIKYLIEKVPECKDITISVHCHNDLGNAVANSLAGVMAGARQVECCMNGLGERAGNASTEEIIMNLHTRKDYFNFDTNINTPEIFKTSKLVSNLTGIKIQRNKAIVGKNAFAHEAGIHQHAVIANKSTYEIMDPKDVGWIGENLVIGKHSGRHAVETVLREENFDFTDEQIMVITAKIKALADQHKTIEREDVIALALDNINELKEEEKIINLIEYEVKTGSSKPKAKVKINIDGNIKEGESEGVGPVDALSNAIFKLIELKFKLISYHLEAITGGTDALAHVSITLRDDEKNVFNAKAVNEDIIEASAKAMIQGLNKGLISSRNRQRGKK